MIRVEPIHTVCRHLPLCFLRRPALFGHPICCYIHSGSIVADAAVNEDFLWAADILLHPSCQAISSGNLLSHPKITQDCSYLFSDGYSCTGFESCWGLA